MLCLQKSGDIRFEQELLKMPKRLFIVPIVLMFFLGCGGDEGPKYTEEELAQIPQPVRQGLPPPTGGFVLAVGQETISTSQITGPLLPRLAPLAQQNSFDDFANQAMPAVAMAIRDKVADILLHQQAKNAAPEEIDEQLDKAVESEMRRFIVGFGGDYAKAEAFLKNYYGMGWKEFRDYQRRSILSSSYLRGKLSEEKPVTYSEIRQYYEQHKDLYGKDATITIRLIDIDTAQVATDPTTPARQAATQLSDEIMRKLDSGEDFGNLAMQYSHGYRAQAGGLWQPIKPDSLAQPYDVLASRAEQMNGGEIAGPIEAKGHIFIMKLEAKESASFIPFEDVQEEITQQIIMDRKQKAFNEAMDKVMAEAAISGLDDFAMFCLKEIYEQANNQMQLP
jgi:parvulin-like peptidyl-prolyl isomerase